MTPNHYRIITTLCAAAALTAGAETLDWDRIEHWSGEGPNRAALIMQFDSGEARNPGALVWGYRWADGAAPTGEDILRAVAAGSQDLVVLMQMTGSMGHTLCGAGYATDAPGSLSMLGYDLDGAAADSRISFGFYEPNTGMNQTSAPGAEATGLVMQAIEEAGETHVIDHPLNASAFGYAAYDYDYWFLTDPTSAFLWNAGWYNGYWSYWLGTLSTDNLGYSPLGMSSCILEDGDIHAWRYKLLDGPAEADAHTGASEWLPLNYAHRGTYTRVDLTPTESETGRTRILRLDGTPAGDNPGPGIYIIVEGGKTSKRIIR